jgi:hypothetical protein
MRMQLRHVHYLRMLMLNHCLNLMQLLMKLRLMV